MGYNATYGYKNLDSTSEFELEEKPSETLNFLCTDELGQVKVKAEYGVCDICNAPLKGIAFYHGQSALCEKCERQHQKNLRIEKMKKHITNKIKRLHINKTTIKKAV
jgi:hypothetical protein